MRAVYDQALFQLSDLNLHFNTMDNPYNFASPVADHALFFGRANLISRIYSRIGADRPQSVSLVGDPQIGKSSLLRYLAHPKTKEQNLPDPENYIYFYVPVVDKGDLNFENFSKMFWKIILDDIDQYLDLEEKTPSYDLFKRIIEKLSQNQKKVILFFDDFHLTTQNETFPVEFFSFLRSLANNYNLAFITTSYLDLQKLCVSKEIEESPFFNIFSNLTIKPFEESEALQLICDPPKKYGLDLTSEKDRILKEANLFPFLVQLGCHLFFELKKENTSLSDDQYREFEIAFYNGAKKYFESLWAKFDEEQRFVLKEVLSSNKIKNTHQFVLNELARRNYLYLDRHKPRFAVPHFQRFVSAKLGLKPNEKKSDNGFWGYLKRWFSHKDDLRTI